VDLSNFRIDLENIVKKDEVMMSRSATSIFVYSFYLIGQGLLLLIAPNLAMNLFGLPPTQEVWVRVLGYSLLPIAAYFLAAARREVTEIFILSIIFRLALPVVFGAFVALGYAGPALLLLTPFDVLFALWTAWGLWSARPVRAVVRQK
jgi:hypothetical protein